MSFLRYLMSKMSWPWNSGQGSLKVIGIDTDRSATYDFLLMIHSNHGPISYRFQDKCRFQSHPRVFWPPLNGFDLQLGIGDRGQTTRMMGLSGWERSLTISSAVWIQYTNVTDRRTDTGRQQRPSSRIPSRGKNNTGSTKHLLSSVALDRKMTADWGYRYAGRRMGALYLQSYIVSLWSC